MAIYGTHPLSEAITPHGQTFTSVSKTYNKNDNKYMSSTSDETTLGTTSLGKGGVLDSVARHHIEDIDLEKEKVLAESTDILNEYALYAVGKFLEACNKYGDDSKSQLEKRMVEDINRLHEMGVNDTDATMLVMNEYYGGKYVENMSDEDASKFLRTVLRLRINYVNKITSLLSQMLRKNYKLLGLSEEQAKIYIDNLTSGTNKAVQSAGEIKELIKKNADAFMINNGEAVDLRSLGFGVILGPDKFEDLNFIGTNGTNKDGMLTLLQKAMRYDVVLVAHGGESEKLTSSENDKIKVLQKERELLHVYADKLQRELDKYLNTLQYNKEINLLCIKITNSANKMLFEDICYDLKDYCRLNKTKNDKISNIIINGVENSYKSVISCYKSATNDYIRSIKSDIKNAELFNDKDEVKKLNEYLEIIRSNKSAFIKAYEYLAKIDLLRYGESDIIKDNITDIRNFGKKENFWSCQLTKTLKAGYFTEVNELVRQLIKEGFKKICIEDCNPGGHKLADDILATKGVLITYSKFSNYVESSELNLNDPDITSIIEAENNVREFAKSYNIDYDDDIFLESSCQWYLDNYKAINEGIDFVDSLKEFFERVVAGIIGFIKKIFNLVKLAITKIKELFTGKPDETPKNTKTKFNDPIKVKMIDANAKKLVEISCINRDDLLNKSRGIIDGFGKNINELNRKNQNSLKRIEDNIKKVERKAQLSSKVESFIDKLIYDPNEDLLEITESLLLEFEDEDGIVNNDDEDEENNNYEMDADEEDSTTDNQNNEDDDNTEDDDDNVEYSMDDDNQETETEDSNNNSAEDNDQNNEDNNVEYSMEDDNQENNEDSNNYELPDDNEDDNVDYSMDDDNQENNEDSNNTSSENNDNNQNTEDSTTDNQSQNVEDNSANEKLKDLESVVFDELTEAEKQLKIKELKELYTSVYKKCDTVNNSLANIRKNEETIKIIEYISNTLTDLKRYVGDYIINLFDSKTYVENLAQLQKYITIFTAINQVFEQINVENTK